MSFSNLAPLAALKSKESLRADPLVTFKFKNWVARKIVQVMHLYEIYWHSGNFGGKTKNITAIVIALMRREPFIDGHKLPRMPDIVSGLLFVPSYKQSMPSTIKALQEMIGDWPHHITNVPGTAYAQAIYVKQRGCYSDDYEKWSVLYVIPSDGEVPKGARVIFVWADEPPPIKMWEEAVFRTQAGEVFISIITATPLNKKDSARGPGWGPIFKRFEFCLGTPRGGRLRLQSTVEDNEALTPAEIAARVEAAEGMDEAKARLNGEHVDATGGEAFQGHIRDRLKIWMENARPPDDIIEFIVQKERDTKTGKELIPFNCKYECWGEIDENDVYIILIDPARGIDSDGKHDRDGIHVWSRRNRALCGRCHQYFGGWGVGMAAVKIAQAYNNAKIGVLRTGGYGETVLSAIRQIGYNNFLETFDASKVKQQSTQLGTVESYSSRNRWIGAIEQAVLTGDCDIPSANVIQCFLNCIYDDKGKIVGDDDDEDLILAGYALDIIQSRPVKSIEKKQEDLTSMDTFKSIVNKSFGRNVFNYGYKQQTFGNWR